MQERGRHRLWLTSRQGCILAGVAGDSPGRFPSRSWRVVVNMQVDSSSLGQFQTTAVLYHHATRPIPPVPARLHAPLGNQERHRLLCVHLPRPIAKRSASTSPTGTRRVTFNNYDFWKFVDTLVVALRAIEKSESPIRHIHPVVVKEAQLFDAGS